MKVSIVGSPRDREVACSASDRQGANFESCVWRTVSSQSSHHPQKVLLAQFSLYVRKGDLKPDSFHFHSRTGYDYSKWPSRPIRNLPGMTRPPNSFTLRCHQGIRSLRYIVTCTRRRVQVLDMSVQRKPYTRFWKDASSGLNLQLQPCWVLLSPSQHRTLHSKHKTFV